VATEPNGTLLMAWSKHTANGNGDVDVCRLRPGADKCASQTYLDPIDGTVAGEPQVIAMSNSDIDVMMGISGAGENLLFQSTDGGKTFPTHVDIGDMGFDASVRVGSELAFHEDGAAIGDVFNIFSLTAPADPTTLTPYTDEVKTSSLSTSHGGLFTADTDESAADFFVDVAFAPAADILTQSAYATVGTFDHEQLLAMSGNALLTQSTVGADKVQLREYNGSRWSAPETVPNYKNFGPSSWQIAEDSAGQVDVFSDLSDATGYNLYLTTTTNDGKTWTKDQNLGRAIDGGAFDNSLDSIGAGLVEGGNEDNKAIGYPVLAQVSVSIKVVPARQKTHKSAKISGRVLPGTAGHKVYLQQERAGRWYTIKTASLSGAKRYVFHLRSSSPKSFTVRVSSDFTPGYTQYGYSAAKHLRFFKPAHH
jgi:hypothetical protein